MLGGIAGMRLRTVAVSSASDWRAKLLHWSLISAALLATFAFPVIGSQVLLLHDRPLGLLGLVVAYVVLVGATLLPRIAYPVRALALLITLGGVAVFGFVRVSFQVGPGIGCALTVVLAGLLLGRRALSITFVITLLSILFIGALQSLTHAALVAPGSSDPTHFGNWLRAAAAYALFTGVLAAAVTFVVTHIEQVLNERTDALERLRSMSAQHREAEEALDHAQHTILQMQKMEAVGRLAGGVAHDFNNALVVILGWADLLRARPTDPVRLRAGLDEIVAAGNRAAGLTQQLLAFGRKGVLVPRALSPAALIAELARMLQRVLPANITLQTTIAEDVDAIFADPSQMHQVLLNLCLNARDAMPRGGTLEVRALNIDAEGSDTHPPGRWVAISVQDSGVGMDADTQARAFEPFFTTKGDFGSGLGLSSVYGIVKQSGGHVLLESQPGLGSKFCVLLPPCVSDAEKSGAVPVLPALVQASTILVAEDERAVRELMVTTLTAAGHNVLAAEDGSAALELARRYRGKIDLLCTDGVMPGISSATLVADFRLLFPNARVLVCSGHIEERLETELARHQLHYLNKPFTGDAFTRTVAELLVG